MLDKADKAGDFEGSFELGKLFLSGQAVERDPEKGLEFITKAENEGFGPAIVFLAKELISGSHLPKDENAARDKLLNAGAQNPFYLIEAGTDLYQQGRHDWAAWCFLFAYRAGASSAGNNLAYMIRRDEIPLGLEVPAPLELLEKGAMLGDGFCLVNQALCHASGVGTFVDWEKADSIMRNVQEMIESDSTTRGKQESDHPIYWWHQLTREGDTKLVAEGHLVIGWLLRHKKVVDPDGMVASQRFTLARDGGWDIPNEFLTNEPSITD